MIQWLLYLVLIIFLVTAGILYDKRSQEKFNELHPVLRVLIVLAFFASLGYIILLIISLFA